MIRTQMSLRKRSFLICAAMLVSSLSFTSAAQSYQGFGTTTPGGAGGTVVHVTNLNDSGPGSFREAVKQGNRTVVFDVGGEIVLTDYLYVLGANITIDGLTAPSPGITLRNRGLIIRGNKGAHDVIVRGLRVRDSPIDGIQIAYGAYNVVIDHVSVAGSGDENMEITGGSHDVTVAWSILAGPGKNMLIKYDQPSRITLHHNVFTVGLTRNPQTRIDDAGTPATDTTLDMRNNLIWNWGIGYGTLVWYGPRANIVNNYYSSSDEAITVSSARAYVQGNESADQIDINRHGNEPSPFPAPFVDTQTACTAAYLALTDAGARPPDSLDQQFLSAITVAPCSEMAPTLSVSPGSLAFGATVGESAPLAQTLIVTNEGDGTLQWGATVTTASGGSWLAISPTSGTAPSAPAVTVNPFGLTEGVYQGRVTVEAGAATNSPQSIPVTLVIDPPPAGLETLQIRISSGGDDGREDGTGKVRTFEALVSPGKGNLFAFRFVGVTIPPGAIVESAVLHFFGLGNLNKHLNLRYLGEVTGDSVPLTQSTGNLSMRLKTAAFVNDIPGPWTLGDFNPSPNLRSIIQEIVDHPSWVPGNSLTLFIADNGSTANRSIGSFESKTSPTKATALTISYQVP
ncbi:hypothetical protein [Candidatus Methylomirabilis sp.]|uniref:BACON domain-containing protein n=1 Tax=Candidatus Methylomirabilis sp. TaxID=2032687 RepID=UPI0030762782